MLLARRPRTVLTALAAAGCLLISSCSADGAPGPTDAGTAGVPSAAGIDDGSGTPTTAPNQASSTPVPTLPSGVTQNPLPDATAIPDDVDLRTDVVLASCDEIDGGWSAGGTATNRTDAEVTYRITVFFTTSAATTIDFAATEVTVAAGSTAEWTAEKTFTATDPTICVLRGVG